MRDEEPPPPPASPSPASPATPATAATAGTEGSPLKRRLSALLAAEGGAGAAAAAASPAAPLLEAGRMERLLSSEFGEDILKLCEMVAATGAGGAGCSSLALAAATAREGAGNPPLPLVAPRRLLEEDREGEEEESQGYDGGPPLPSTSRDGAASFAASVAGSDDDHRVSV